MEKNKIRFPEKINLIAVPRQTANQVISAACQNFYKNGVVRGYQEGYKRGFIVGGVLTCGLIFTAMAVTAVVSTSIEISNETKDILKEEKVDGSESV